MANTESKAIDTSKSPLITQDESFAEGTYHSVIWGSKRTGNYGFVCSKELIVPERKDAVSAATKYRKQMKVQFGMETSLGCIKLVVPRDLQKFPLLQIEEGGMIICFGLIKGPLFDKAKVNDPEGIQEQVDIWGDKASS